MKASSNEVSYYIDPVVKDLLDKGKKKVIEKDWDRVYIIDGGEGSGKSLLGLQIGYYLDPTLNLERVTFTGEEFANQIKKAKKNQCIIFDEAFNGLSSGAASSRLNRLLVRNLMECRQKNLFIIIILPTIFLLQKYAGVFRSQSLFHVYATKKGVRGYYKIYNQKNKKLLFLTGQKFYSYQKPYIKMSRRFYGKYPVDEIEYRKKKLRSLEISEKEEVMVDRKSMWLGLLFKFYKEKNINNAEVMRYIKAKGSSLDKATIQRYITNTNKMLVAGVKGI